MGYNVFVLAMLALDLGMSREAHEVSIDEAAAGSVLRVLPALVFVGAKLLLIDDYSAPIGLSPGVTATVLTVSLVASSMFPEAAENHDPAAHDPHPEPASTPTERVYESRPTPEEQGMGEGEPTTELGSCIRE